jgi:tetratricopeptide (TPR) repeat protein
MDGRVLDEGPRFGFESRIVALGASAFLSFGFAIANAQESDANRPGKTSLGLHEPIEAELTDADPEVATPVLLRDYADAEVHGRRYRIATGKGQPCVVTLESYNFDAYLVVRDADGAPVAEDDDGFGSTHALVRLEMPANGGERFVEACALHGDRGWFRLSLTESEAGTLDPDLERAWSGYLLARAEEAESPQVIAAMQEVGFRLWRAKRYHEAKRTYELQFAINERKHGSGAPETARSLHNLGAQLRHLGDVSGARAAFERAIRIREEKLGPGDPATLETTRELAGLFFSTPALSAEAPTVLQRALDAHEKHVGLDDGNTLTIRSMLITSLMRRSRYREARPLVERQAELLEKNPRADARLVRKTRDQKAAILSMLGEWSFPIEVARRDVEEARKRAGPESVEYATALRELAVVLITARSGAEPLGLLQQALAIVQSKRPGSGLHAQLLQDLGVLECMRGDAEHGRPLLLQAKAIQERMVPADIAGLSKTLASLVPTAASLEEKTALWEQIVAMRRRALGRHDVTTAAAEATLASLCVGRGEFAKAKELCESALRTFEQIRGPNHVDTALVQRELAEVLARLDRRDEAVTLLRQALANSEAHFALALATKTEVERLRFASDQRQALDDLIELERAAPPAERAALWSVALRWKGVVARSERSTREEIRGSRDPVVRDLLRDLQAITQRLSTSAYASDPASPDPGADLVQLTARKEELERDLATRTGALADEVATPEAIAAALPQDAALVDFVVIASPLGAVVADDPDHPRERTARLVAWTLRAGERGPVFVDLGSASEARAAVERFLAQLHADRGAASLTADGEHVVDPAAEVAHRVWEPIAERLAGARLVILSPDSFLGRLPFEVLPAADGSRLVAHRSFVYLQDVAQLPDLLARTAATDAPPSLLCAGGIDFNARDDLSWARPAGDAAPRSRVRRTTAFWPMLDGAKEESASVRDLHRLAFGDAAPRLVLTGAVASEERLKAALPDARFVHLATHGYFEGDRRASRGHDVGSSLAGVAARTGAAITPNRDLELPGLLSGLVCSGANLPDDAGDARDDGFLTAEELGWLDLSHVDLVVLSACDTAIGLPESGEGLLGLRRSLRQAGARTVIASLWKADDALTCELMKRFYVNLWQRHLGTLAALHEAQLSMLADPDVGRRRINGWGAFVLDGDWR